MKKLAVSSLVIAFILTLSALAVVSPTSADAPTVTEFPAYANSSDNVSLAINSTGCGAVFEPGQGVFSYLCGTVVHLSASPMPCYGCNFISWTGDVGTIADVNSSSTNISMYDNYSIVAEFTCSAGGTPTASPTTTATATSTIIATATPTTTATPTETPLPTETPAPKFNASDWAYSQSGTVTASGECGNLSDYQVRLTLHYGAGTNSGSDIYLGGLCQPDFEDVRFTKADGVTLLDYWVQKLNTGSNATVWVEFDSISTVGTEFYIYYGNLNASSASNGPDTCLIFDDLESGSIDTGTWDVKQSYGSVGIKTDKKFGEYSIGSDQAAGQGGGLDMYDQNHYFLKLADGADAGYRVLMDAKRWYTTAWPGHFCGFGFGGTNELRALASPEQYRHNGFPPTDAWHSYETRIQRINASAVGAVIIEDDSERYDGVSNVTQGSELQFGVQTRHNGIYDNTIYVRSDNVCVGSYCDPEPTISWGDSELDDWAYNQSGTVTASGECGNLSDYQVRLTLHYGAGTNSGSDIYLGGLCQPDFDDVRFTKADGVTLLDYWQEKGAVNPYNDSVLWVEFDSISTEGTEFYIYYGNPDASSASNGYDTFLIFNDGTSIDGWSEHWRGGEHNWSTINGVIRCTSVQNAGYAWSNLYYPEPTGTDYYVAECAIRAQDGLTPGNYQQGMGYEVYDPMARWLDIYDTWELRDTLEWGDSSWTRSVPDPTFDARDWHQYSFVKNGNDWKMYVDDDLKVTRSAKSVSQYIGLYTYLEAHDHWAEFDDFRVRNYCDPEPTIDWGVNVTQPTPTPTATATAASTPEVANVWIDFVDSPGVNVTLRVGTNGNFIVRTNISGVEDLKIAQYDIIYDPGVVHVKKKAGWQPDIKAGEIGGESFPVLSASFVPQETQGRVRVIHNLDGVRGVSGSGYMSSIGFRVVGSPEETGPIQIRVETLNNVALQPIPHNTTNSSVLVILPWQPGDANMDGYIDAGDITKTERIILGWEVATNLSDANLDGVVNAADIGTVEYKILNIWPWNHVHIGAPQNAACETDFFATVYVNYIEDFGSSICEVNYNPCVLDLVDVTGGEMLEVAGASSYLRAVDVTGWNLVGGPGKVRINSIVAGGGGVSGAGYLARLRFQVNGSAWQVSPIALNESASWLRNALGGDIAGTWTGDSVTVVP